MMMVNALMFASVAHRKSDDVGGPYCARLFDYVSCWPKTEPGRLAAVACPTHFQGLQLTGGQYNVPHCAPHSRIQVNVKVRIYTALRYGSHRFTCKLHHACLYLVSVHHMAPPLIVVVDI